MDFVLPTLYICQRLIYNFHLFYHTKQQIAHFIVITNKFWVMGSNPKRVRVIYEYNTLCWNHTLYLELYNFVIYQTKMYDLWLFMVILLTAQIWAVNIQD